MASPTINLKLAENGRLATATDRLAWYQAAVLPRPLKHMLFMSAWMLLIDLVSACLFLLALKLTFFYYFYFFAFFQIQFNQFDYVFGSVWP